MDLCCYLHVAFYCFLRFGEHLGWIQLRAQFSFTWTLQNNKQIMFILHFRGAILGAFESLEASTHSLISKCFWDGPSLLHLVRFGCQRCPRRGYMGVILGCFRGTSRNVKIAVWLAEEHNFEDGRESRKSSCAARPAQCNDFLQICS